MKYEVIEDGGAWVLLHDEREIARFAEQDEALAYIGERLRGRPEPSGRYALVMRYQSRS